MKPEESNTEAIDLSVAFFCAVLVLFVFVAFNRQTPEAPEDTVSIGQLEHRLAAIPGGWSPTVSPGGFAVLEGDSLYVLDLAIVADGVADPLAQIATDRGWFRFRAIDGPAPNAFRLDLSLLAGNPEPLLLRSAHDLSQEGAAICPGVPDGGNYLAVVAATDHPDLGPLLRFGANCGLQIRVEPFDLARGSELLRVGLSRTPASYSSERIFR